MKKLTNKQAIDLLPAVVDKEATEDEMLSFFSFIESNQDVKKQYEIALLVKKIVSTRCPKARAPDHLKKRILESIQQHENSPDIHTIQDQVSSNLQGKKNTSDHNTASNIFNINPVIRYLMAAALILFLSLVTIDLLDRTSSYNSDNVFLVEEYAAEHFINSNGSLITPHFSTHSTKEAQDFILAEFGMELEIPELIGTEFKGVVTADFYNEYQTPLLEYEQTDIGEVIYIFAFEVNDIDSLKALKRHGEAVKSCVFEDDYYVLDVNGTDVVSWLWNGNWYTAISNHNGNDLASLVKPLNITPPDTPQ